MQLPIKEAISDAGRYVVGNPSVVLRMLAHAASLRLAIPLDIIRWLASHILTGDDDPGNVRITAVPPGLRLEAEAVFMRNAMKAGATLVVKSVTASPDELTVSIRVDDLTMEAKDPKSPLAQLLKSGALPLDKPGNLMKMAGKLPPVVAETSDDVLVLDLMQVPEIRDNAAVRQALEAFTPVIPLEEVYTDEDLLLIAFRAVPSGFPRMLSSIRSIVQQFLPI